MRSKRETFQFSRRTMRDDRYAQVPASHDHMEEIPFQPSNLETIDQAMFDWVNERIDVFCTTNKGFTKVPVIWVSSERAYQIKKQKGLRDNEGTLVLPIITIERTSVIKSLSKKGVVFSNIPPHPDAKGGVITISKQINQKKTSNFANADSSRRYGNIDGSQDVKRGGINFPRTNEKVVYESISIPIPVYLDITYSISIRTEYQQQMNEILSPFMVKTGGVNYFSFGRSGHRYEGFIEEDYSQENNIASLGEEERQYASKINVKALAYVFGADKNEEQPFFVRRQNAVEVRIGREKLILGQITDEDTTPDMELIFPKPISAQSIED